MVTFIVPGWDGGRGGGGLPAAYNFKTVNDIEMKFGSVK